MKKQSDVKMLETRGDTWSLHEYGERLFKMGGYYFGSHSQMFKLSIAALCVDILAQDCAKAPLRLYRRLPNGGKAAVMPSEHPVAKVLEVSPNPYQGPREFIRVAVANLAVDARYYMAARRNGNGELLEMAGVRKECVTDHVNAEERQWFYDITPGTLHEKALFGWAAGRVGSGNVADIRVRSMNGADVISNGTLMRDTLKVLSDMNRSQGSFYARGGMGQLAVSFPDAMTDEQYTRLVAGIRKRLKLSEDTGVPLVLEGNGEDMPKVENLTQKAGDAEFNQSKLQMQQSICQFFRVPPHKAFLLESVKYDNLSAQERVYVFDTLFVYFECIEEALNRTALTEAEREDYFIAFDRSAAYAVDPKTHQEIVESQWNKGMLEFDEMRVAIGQNPMGGEQGRYRIMSGNFVMMDKDGNVVMQAGGNDPDKNQTDDASKASPPALVVNNT